MDESAKYAGADCLLLPKEVAVLLGCTVDDARTLMKAKIIPSIRFGTILKTRKFAFNTALEQLDNKDVSKMISEAKQVLSNAK